MMATQFVDVRALIDARRLGPFQLRLLLLGFLTIVLDGFDAVIMSFIVPQLRMEWGVTHQALGAVLSAALIGQAIGAMVSGPLADRYGRKPVVVTSVAFIAVWTLATALSGDVAQMVAFRLLTGLALGAAIPNTSTLVSEYAPQRIRSFMITVTLCGFTVGGTVAGLLSAWMIPAFGWKSVLVVGGILPLALAGVLSLTMPESIGFLIVRGKSMARIAAIVARLAPDVPVESVTFTLGRSTAQSTSAIRLVFSPGYRFGTAMLWCGYFCVLFLIYLLSSWLPTLVKEGGGYSVSQSAIATSMFQVGGPVGSLAIGWAMDRWNRYRVLAAAFLMGAVAVASIGQVAQHYSLLCAAAFVVGICMSGGSVGMTALATTYYPTEARSTGSSWMLGIGRMGAILSAVVGAQVLALKWSLADIFIMLIIPATVAAIAVTAMRRWGVPDRPPFHSGAAVLQKEI